MSAIKRNFFEKQNIDLRRFHGRCLLIPCLSISINQLIGDINYSIADKHISMQRKLRYKLRARKRDMYAINVICWKQMLIEDINFDEQKNNVQSSRSTQSRKWIWERRSRRRRTKRKENQLRALVCTIRVKCSSHTKPWLTKKTLINRWLDCARARNLSETWETNEKCVWKIETIVEAPCWL